MLEKKNEAIELTDDEMDQAVGGVGISYAVQRVNNGGVSDAANHITNAAVNHTAGRTTQSANRRPNHRWHRW
jgi:hypothetical protein